MAKTRMGGITVEIEADTSDISKKLKDVNAESRKTTSELKSIDAALKQAPNSVELWQQKQEALAKVLENSKKRLEALNPFFSAKVQHIAGFQYLRAHAFIKASGPKRIAETNYGRM